MALAVLAPAVVRGQEAKDQAQQKDQAPAAAPGGEDFSGPPPLKDVPLGPVLPTVPINRRAREYNWHYVETTLLPKDPQGIWVLDFAFKPVRIVDLEVPGKGRRKIHYLYYRVVNHTGKPRMFAPQFTLVTDTGKKYEDSVMRWAVERIRAREEPTVRLLGAVDIMGILPPSTKQGVDDAVFGVAIWEGVDPDADRFSIYVQGLSDGNQIVTPPQGGSSVVQHKTLRIDFLRRGDKHDIHEKEIELLDPPYEWIYW